MNQKLIRDRIPERIEKDGLKAIIHVAAEEEFRQKLMDKLEEEVKEYISSNNIEELGDILEVVFTIAENQNISQEELLEIKKQKQNTNGGFTKKYILEKVE